MKFIWISLIALVLGLGSLAPAASQGTNDVAPSTEALQVAQELVSVMTSNDMLDEMASRMTSQMWPAMLPALRTKYPDLNDAAAAEMQAAFKRELVATMNNSVVAGAPAIYARHFSVAEMRDILAFYHTPTGAKVLAQMPQIQAESMALIFPTLSQVQQRIDRTFEVIVRNHATATVASKVVLYEEDKNDPAGYQYVGNAAWHIEPLLPAPEHASDAVIKAEVEIPDRRIGIQWSLRRNDDKALPTSHTIEIRFTLPADFPHGGISNVPGLLMKQGEATRGEPLRGRALKATTNVFLIGLSSTDADMLRNVQLLKERAWVDIPVVYDDGTRAIVVIEKGTPGERVFADAFAAWGQ